MKRQCHKTGCDSAATNEVSLHLSCPSPGLPARIVGMKCSIEVCDVHKDDVRGYVLSDVNKEHIVEVLMNQGVPEPDFLSAVFEFTPITAPALGAVAEVAVKPVLIGCDRADCPNPAKFRILLRYRSLAQGGRGDPVCDSMTNMHVCRRHKREVKPADFVDAESRAATLEFLRGQGMLLPDVDRPIVDFIELVSGEPEAAGNRRSIAQ